MLIQSWGDTIRIFPAVPAKWPEVGFSDLRAEGAFLVGALRKEGRTVFVSIRSLAGEPCRVQTGIEGPIKVAGIDESSMTNLGGGLVELDLLSDDELDWINDYHAEVRAKIAPHLAPAERQWLENATQPIGVAA